MIQNARSFFAPAPFWAAAACMLFTGANALAQCSLPEVTSGLQSPLGITQSNTGNLLVSETGPAPNSGSISIVSAGGGERRALISGLPSGINDVGDPSGPSGLAMRGRTLYVLVGIGDTARSGPAPGTNVLNPSPSSPIMSSVLALQFSANAEMRTSGFSLTFADQQALASGAKVTLTDDEGNRMSVELVVDFPNSIPAPVPAFPTNVAASNPFGLVVVANHLYVTDGGQNRVWKVDLATGTASVLAIFPDIANPLFPAVGGPVEQAVPTGIAYSDGKLLVTLFRGAPFAPGTSTVEQVDPDTGLHSPLISGLKTAIDVFANSDGYLVLQHASIGPFFGGPGLLLRFATPAASPEVVTNCLVQPSSMVVDEKSGVAYITELSGNVVAASLED